MKILDHLKKPAVAAVLGGLIGLILGLIYAYLIDPVKWTDVPPTQLGTAYQEQYLRMAIDSYSVHPDNAMAVERYKSLGEAGATILETIKSDPGNLNAEAISKFETVINPQVAVQTPEAAGGQVPANKPSPSSILIILVAVVLFALVGYGILRYLLPRLRNTQNGSMNNGARKIDIAGQPETPPFESSGQEQPISQFITTYALGDDLFDDSFSIDSPTGEFLGECGVGISEIIGFGEPKKVQAFEVWLFDKNDIQTVTKVLMSPHAFNDVATFQRLQAKGEPSMVERGKQIVLETAALQMVATVSDAEYGQGALPEESYFDRLTLEISVWSKIAPLTR
jgi:hypothetical protein